MIPPLLLFRSCLEPAEFPSLFADRFVSIGPLNGLFFLLANVTPVVNTAASLYPVDLTTRTCEGNVDDVGVDGRTLMEFLGDRGDFRVMLFSDADDVEEAFE